MSERRPSLLSVSARGEEDADIRIRIQGLRRRRVCLLFFLARQSGTSRRGRSILVPLEAVLVEEVFLRLYPLVSLDLMADDLWRCKRELLQLLDAIINHINGSGGVGLCQLSACLRQTLTVLQRSLSKRLHVGQISSIGRGRRGTGTLMHYQPLTAVLLSQLVELG